MVEKMKFINLTGPKDDIDRVVDEYLSKYDIHLENALSELNTVHNLTPFAETNPYKDILSKSEDLIKDIDKNIQPSEEKMSPAQASKLISDTLSEIASLTYKKQETQNQYSHLTSLLKQIEPFLQLDYDIKKILDFKFIKFRFGKILHEYFDTLDKYVYENLDTVFYECANDKEFVWGVYFVPVGEADRIDAIFSSLHFERIIIPDEYEGKPKDIQQKIQSELSYVNQTLIQTNITIKQKINEIAGKLLAAHQILKNLDKNYEIRKLAACTKERQEVYYILCGWMTEKDEIALMKDIKDDPDIYCYAEDGADTLSNKPPTKLKNPKLFRPFEMFIKMYGLPAYNELDPTIFVALTYSFMFGMMFGDAGQGFCLLVGGFYPL